MADTAEDRDLVLFEAHARAAAIAETAAAQFALDPLDRHDEAGRQTLDDDREGLTVGFTGGEVAKHGRKSTGGVTEPGFYAASPAKPRQQDQPSGGSVEQNTPNRPGHNLAAFLITSPTRPRRS